MSLSPNLRGAALMAGAMTGFAISDACMKGLSAHWPLFQSIFLRACATTMILAVMTWRMGQLRPVARRDAALIGLRTIFEVAAGWCYLWALTQMPLANVSAIQQAVPLAVTLGGMLVLGERAGRAQLILIVAGFGGVLLILRPGTEGFTWASLAMLGSVAATSARDLSSRMLSPGVPAVLVATAASGGMALLGAGGALAVDWQPLSAPVSWMLGGSVGAVILGYVASVSAMRVGQIAAVMPFRYTSLLIAIVLGVAAFGTVPGPLTLLGAGVVVATGLATILRDRRRPRPEEEATPGA